MTEKKIRSYKGPLDPSEVSEYDTGKVRKTIIDQDVTFQARMMAAYQKGLESPPMIGIDTRPCTKKPLLFERGRIPQSHK